MEENKKIKISLKTLILLIIIILVVILALIIGYTVINEKNNLKEEKSNGESKTEILKMNEEIINSDSKEQNKITNEMLTGDWEFKNVTDKNGKEISSMELFGSAGVNGYFTFLENGRFINNLTGGNSSEFIDEGKYTINAEKIELKYDDGRKEELTSSDKDGNKVLVKTENDYILYMSKRTNSDSKEQNKITNEMLTGDWEFKNVTDKNGKEISSMELFGSAGVNGYFTFLENGRFINNLTGGNSSEFIDEGKYTINAEKIELKYDDGRKEELTSSDKDGNKVLVKTENDYILYMSKRTNSDSKEQNKITNEMLTGDWEFKNVTDKNGKEISSMELFGSAGVNGYFTFLENGRFINNLTGGNSSEFIDEGKYTINDEKIELKYDDGRKGELTSSDKDGNKVLVKTENDYILYMSKKINSDASKEDINNNSDLIGKWNTYEVIDKENSEKLDPSQAFGSGYKGISYLELKEDGTFQDLISPISSSEFINEGKYEVKRNYNKYGDCYIILNYIDGRSLTFQRVYFSDDNVPTLVSSTNSKSGYEYYLKK